MGQPNPSSSFRAEGSSAPLNSPLKVGASLSPAQSPPLEPHCTHPSHMAFPKPSLALLPSQNNWSLSFP